MKNLTRAELQSRLIYAMIVAGKSAEFTNSVMSRLFLQARELSPFQFIARLDHEGRLGSHLRACRTGNYTKLERGLRELVKRNLDLKRCTTIELECVHGIGPKTSRFFILWTRPGAELAALDVHVLRWLGTQGHQVPRSTPSGDKYRRLEEAFLIEAEKRGMTARELDSMIWDAGSRAENIA